MQNELILNEQSEGGELALSQNAAQFIERFLSDADIAPTTKDTYRKALRQFFIWYAARGGGDLARAEILAYKQAQLSRMQANTVGAYLSALRTFFRWLESEKLYPNVAAGVKGVKLSNGHRKDALTPEQVGRVLETLKGNTLQAKRDYALFNLLVRTGLRTIEIERANIEDMRNKGAVTVLYIQGKGRQSKDEFVVLTDAAVRPIYAYLAARRASGREVVEPESPLFASLSTRTYGKRLVTRSLRGIMKKALRVAGYDDSRLTTHSLRHTAVTLALMGGASIQQAQTMARHTSINTTMIYSHYQEFLILPITKRTTLSGTTPKSPRQTATLLIMQGISTKILQSTRLLQRTHQLKNPLIKSPTKPTARAKNTPHARMWRAFSLFSDLDLPMPM